MLVSEGAAAGVSDEHATQLVMAWRVGTIQPPDKRLKPSAPTTTQTLAT